MGCGSHERKTVYRPLTEADIPDIRALMRTGYAFVAQCEDFTPEQLEGAMATRDSEAAWRDYVRTHKHRGAWLEGILMGVCILHADERIFLYVPPTLHSWGIGRK